MYLDKENILNSLTKEDIIKIVVGLGSSYPKTDSQGNLIFNSICHGSESHKLYYYHEATGDYKGKTFHCYSQCGDSFNIVELVIRVNRVQGKTITWYKALRCIGQITNKLIVTDSDIKINQDIINDFIWINKFKNAKKSRKEVPVLSEINENTLDIFYYAPHEDWLK